MYGVRWGKSPPLTTDELKVIFKIVAAGGGQEEARRALPHRNRITVNRAYNVIAELERKDISSHDDITAEKIETEAKYSATTSYVQKVFIHWRAWKQLQHLIIRPEPRKAPQVIIEFDPQRQEDLGLKTLEGEPWQFACVRCKNVSKPVAQSCRAVLTLVSGTTVTGSQGPFYLNPVDLPYTLKRESVTPVGITPGPPRSWDLAFAPPGHGQTSPVITSGPIYAVSVPAEVRGKPPQEMDWGKGGACIAIPIAVTRRGVPQAHLLPNEYRARLEIHDESGKIAEAMFQIRAPQPGGKLDVVLESKTTSIA